MRLGSTPLLTAVLALAAIAATDGARAQPVPPSPGDAEAFIRSAVRLAEEGHSLEALAKADDAYFAIWSGLPLAFRRIELIDGPPRGYDEIKPRETDAYDPGEEISIYVDPVGFGWRRVEDRWESDLVADFILSTPEGRILAGQKNFGEFRIGSRQRARESFLVMNYQFTGVPPGDYVLTTTVRDRIDEESASFETEISIK